MEHINESVNVNTVGELIELLQKYPDDTKVVYDDGLGLVVSEYEYGDGTIAVNFT